MSNVTPLRVTPIPVTRVWGGERLLGDIHADKSLRAEPPVGETWEISDVGGDAALHSTVSAGEHAGRTLRQLVLESPEVMLGAAVAPTLATPHLPLLYKFIDAGTPLSVQVHPDDALVQELGLDGYGKTEAWIIMEAEPEAEIVYGLEPGLDLAGYVGQARQGRGAEGFCRLPVKKGDIVFLPAGVVHAIGAGILLAEIQQSSDITYRIYDWDRMGLDGKPRQLHLDECEKVGPPTHVPPCPLPEPSGEEGFHCRIEGPPFSLWELRAQSTTPRAIPHDVGQRFGILSVLEGSASLRTPHGDYPLGRGQTLFVPAAAEISELEPSPASWTLWMHP